jgi:hypothetical protein
MIPAASAAAAISSVFFIFVVCVVVLLDRVQGQSRRNGSRGQTFFKLFLNYFRGGFSRQDAKPPNGEIWPQKCTKYRDYAVHKQCGEIGRAGSPLPAERVGLQTAARTE